MAFSTNASARRLAPITLCIDGWCRLSANSEVEAQELAEIEQRLATYTLVLSSLAEHDDWRQPLGSLIQPLPFPEE